MVTTTSTAIAHRGSSESNFRDNKKLGSWTEYLKMREVILKTNEENKSILSSDLGAIAGLLYEIGMRKIIIEGQVISEEEKIKLLKQYDNRHKEVLDEKQEEDLHTEMQYRLLKVGKALGYDPITASNDRSKCYGEISFSFISLNQFPTLSVDKDTLSTIQLIDVIWFEKDTNKVVCAFEVEKSTSIYSGILRLSDLAFSLPDHSHRYSLLFLTSVKRMLFFNSAGHQLRKARFI